MRDNRPMVRTGVELVGIDDEVLEQLVAAARLEDSPADVMAPLPGSPGWGPFAEDAFRQLHRSRRPGLAGPHHEATYAVRTGNQALGVLRLFRPDGADDDSVLEVGMWLSRLHRGAGIGRAALLLGVARARDLGAVELVADTTATNLAAQAVLRRAGFVLAEPAGSEPSSVQAARRLR